MSDMRVKHGLAVERIGSFFSLAEVLTSFGASLPDGVFGVELQPAPNSRTAAITPGKKNFINYLPSSPGLFAKGPQV
jgi:hypothetical protein